MNTLVHPNLENFMLTMLKVMDAQTNIIMIKDHNAQLILTHALKIDIHVKIEKIKSFGNKI